MNPTQTTPPTEPGEWEFRGALNYPAANLAHSVKDWAPARVFTHERRLIVDCDGWGSPVDYWEGEWRKFSAAEMSEDERARALAASLHGNPNNPWATGSSAWVEFSRQFHAQNGFYPQDASDMEAWKWFMNGVRFVRASLEKMDE